MNANTHFKINSSQVVHETIDDETILLNLETGCYFSLDFLGGMIWESIEAEICVSQIIEALKNQFQDQESEIDSSVAHFITELIEEELLVQKEKSSEVDGMQPGEDLINKLKNINQSSYGPPTLNKYTDMQDILRLDPIHDVDESTGWPKAKSE